MPFVRRPGRPGVRSEASRWAPTLKKVIAFESLEPIVKYGYDDVDGKRFLFDVHKVEGGINAAYEILPFKAEGYPTALEAGWLAPDVFLMPYSGFALPAHDENLSGNAAQDDHFYYQACARERGVPPPAPCSANRGVDLLTYGPTQEEAQRKMRQAIRDDPTVKSLLRLRVSPA